MAAKYNSIIELTEKELTRFWASVAPMDENGCRLWTASRSGPRPNALYGKFVVTRDGKLHQFTATRVAYFLYTGKQPGDLLVCHKCDIPLCVAKDHLFLGTYTDNMRDAWDKGRMPQLGNPWVTHPDNMPRGEKHGRSKINEQAVREIRTQELSGDSQHVIAARMGVSQALISLICRRKIWQHLDP